MQWPRVSCRPSGPRNARIVAVGEAPGEQEEIAGIPFVGWAGQELTRMLTEAGLNRSEIFFTNVFDRRPPSNKLIHFCLSRKEVGSSYSLPPLMPGKYVHPELLDCLPRLKSEIESVQPNLILALGNPACWALLQMTKISKIRGTTTDCVLVPGLKVLPTYHPSYVNRNWSVRPIVIADLMKAEREQHFKEVRRPHRIIHFDPTMEEVFEWREILLRAPALAIDTETKFKQITTVGFSPSRDSAYVFPFVDFRKSGNRYWQTFEEEKTAWLIVKELVESPIPKVFQNGLYDLQYFVRMLFRPRNCTDDTMILHHALFPEIQKDLGFLGSIYTNEASWKIMRPRGEDSMKRDE